MPKEGFYKIIMHKQVFDNNNPNYNKNMYHQKLSYIVELHELELLWKIQDGCKLAGTGS